MVAHIPVKKLVHIIILFEKYVMKKEHISLNPGKVLTSGE
jgi:hypothetical protein